MLVEMRVHGEQAEIRGKGVRVSCERRGFLAILEPVPVEVQVP